MTETPEQKKRRRSGTIAHVYRSRRTGLPEADDAADEEEVEVVVDVDAYRAEPDVGLRGRSHGGARVDNGADIALTPDEVERIAFDAEEDAIGAYEEAMEARGDAERDR